MENKHVNRIFTNSRNLKSAFVSKASDPLNCRLELTGNNGKLTKEKASKLFAHIGCTDPECWVCRMVKGTKLYKTKIPSEYRVYLDRAYYKLTMDFIQWSTRSSNGNFYTLNMHDTRTKMYFGIHMVFKDDIYEAMIEFLKMMRSDDRFNWMDYKFATEIECDSDAQWVDSEEWDRRITKVYHVRLRISDPSDKNSNARSELANKEMERRTKSLLYARNLPPSDWEDC